MIERDVKRRRMNWPLALTLLRLLLVPVFLVLVVIAAGKGGRTSWRLGALVVFAVMALSDFLDGFLARRLKQTTRLGTLLDPAADKILLSASLLLFCFQRYAPGGFAIPWAVALGVFLKDIGVMIGAGVIVARLGKVRIVSRLPGKISTAMQVTLILVTLLAPELVGISAWSGELIWALWWGTVLSAAVAAGDYARQGAIQLRSAEAARNRL